MSKYLFIESRDPFECPDVQENYRLMLDLSMDGHDICVFLVQNAVFPCRKESQSKEFSACLKDPSIEVTADIQSIEERGMKDDLHEDVRLTTMDECAKKLMEDGCKAIWH